MESSTQPTIISRSEWPCLNTMKKVKLIIMAMGLISILGVIFFSYLNYKVSLNTYIETKKIADFVLTLDAVDPNELFNESP